MGNTPDTDEKEGAPDLVRDICDEVFEQLESIGGKEFARHTFKSAFWFSYDGHSRPVVPENAVPWLLRRLDGARLMLDVLAESGAFEHR